MPSVNTQDGLRYTGGPDDVMATPGRPDLRAQIRALLPPHTHEQPGGLFSLGMGWTWTTPQGTWTVRLGAAQLLGPTSLAFTGPGGEWTFERPDERGVEQLAAVLRTLNGIEAAQ